VVSLEDLQKDLSILVQRKEQSMQGINQILGAISIIEQLIQRLLKNEPINDVPTMDTLENPDGEANCETAQ
jgi:hypothetical protein